MTRNVPGIPVAIVPCLGGSFVWVSNVPGSQIRFHLAKPGGKQQDRNGEIWLPNLASTWTSQGGKSRIREASTCTLELSAEGLGCETTDFIPDRFVPSCRIISYRRQDPDQAFARDLLHQLEAVGLKVAIDERDFDPVATFLDEMERCIKESQFTLIVASPRYFESGNCKEEAIICKVLDMKERRRRTMWLGLTDYRTPPRNRTPASIACG